MPSFSTALSGLNAQASAIDAVGNNLANLNTTGYKATTVSFQDLVGQELSNSYYSSGMGVKGPTVSRSFSQGAVQLTEGKLDAAIQGDGFFLTKDAQNNLLLTRAGNFTVDANGYLVTLSGERVQGWNAAGGALSVSATPTDLVLPGGTTQVPVATSTMAIHANLNAAAAADGSFSTPVQVVDSLGGTHVVTINFTKSGANAWDIDVTIPGEEVGGTAGTPQSIGSGSLAFDGNGVLTDPAAPASISLAIAGLANGASDMAIDWSLFGANGSPLVTQYEQPSATSAIEQNGATSSELLKVSIADGGKIVASYANGREVAVGQLALANVRNPDSLVALGNNNFQVGGDTSNLSIGLPDAGGRGKIVGGALEASTVNIAKEFTNLIVYQRGYQANSKVITTLDEITQDVLNIKR